MSQYENPNEKAFMGMVPIKKQKVLFGYEKKIKKVIVKC